MLKKLNQPQIMAGVNKVILLGRLGKDPEIKTFGNDNQLANLTVATSKKIKDQQSGEWNEKTEWHNVTVFGFSAKYAEKYLNKGSQVYIEGELETTSYEKDGVTKYSTKIIVSGYNGVLQGLGGNPQSEGNQQAPQQQQRQQQQPVQAAQNLQPANAEDDLPF